MLQYRQRAVNIMDPLPDYRFVMFTDIEESNASAKPTREIRVTAASVPSC